MRPNKSLQKGYIVAMKYYSNIPKSVKAVADFRVKVIEHKLKHGIRSALDAYPVSRASIYAWQKSYLESNKNKQALVPKSTKPKRTRISKLDYRIVDEIARLRCVYPNLGKSKLKVSLDEFCQSNNLTPISESSIGRCIKHLKVKGSIASNKRLSYYARTGKLREHSYQTKPKQRRQDYYPKSSGGLIQLDCVIKIHHRLRRYIISAIDYTTSFAYSYAYQELNSRVASDFLDKLLFIASFKISHIQTDNGSEFASEFDSKLDKLGITHFWNYARKPIYNGKIERFNRTIQEEFIDPCIDELFQDMAQFNNRLADWLIYYNTKRPHFSHRDPGRPNIQIPPLKAYANMLKLNPEESRMLWTQTKPLLLCQSVLK